MYLKFKIFVAPPLHQLFFVYKWNKGAKFEAFYSQSFTCLLLLFYLGALLLKPNSLHKINISNIYCKGIVLAAKKMISLHNMTLLCNNWPKCSHNGFFTKLNLLWSWWHFTKNQVIQLCQKPSTRIIYFICSFLNWLIETCTRIM